jgi:FkbM family methyltransferase
LWSKIHFIGFDPNKEECKKVEGKSGHFLKATILPFAVYDRNGNATLYKTKSIYCYSLLKPNPHLLNRFYSYKRMFELVGEETVPVRRLDEIAEVSEAGVDVIKIDSQGVELPILLNAIKAVTEAFMINVEVGFIEGYKGQQCSFGEVEVFMKEHGFALFDLNYNHRMPRDNVFKDNYLNEQMIYSESIWLKDYISMYQIGKIQRHHFTRQKVIKILTLCSVHGCYSYGYELATFFSGMGLISEQELKTLGSKNVWRLKGDASGWRSFIKKIINLSIGLMPESLRFVVKNELESVEKEKFYNGLSPKVVPSND